MAQKNQFKDVKPLSDKEHDELISKMMNESNPSKARAKGGIPFEPSSKTSKTEKPKNRSEEKGTSLTSKRPSVRQQLMNFKDQQSKRNSAPVLKKRKTKGR